MWLDGPTFDGLTSELDPYDPNFDHLDHYNFESGSIVLRPGKELFRLFNC